MKDHVKIGQKEELKGIKKSVNKALKRLDLTGKVSMQEIEIELRSVETALESLLILGILSLILYRGDDEAAELFVPAVTQWKNHLPHEDLNGMSPAQFREKHPPGPYEAEFMNALMGEYQGRLRTLSPDTKEGKEIQKDPEKDFDRFQKEFFERIPLEQPFIEKEGSFMTIKEIIKEERSASGMPPDKIDEIGIKLFAENTAEGAGAKIAQLEDTYRKVVNELDMMHKTKKKRIHKRVKELRKILEDQELYHKAGPAAHQFYFNYSVAVFLDERNPDTALELLDKALSYEPDYDTALNVRKNIKNNYPHP